MIRKFRDRFRKENVNRKGKKRFIVIATLLLLIAMSFGGLRFYANMQIQSSWVFGTLAGYPQVENQYRWGQNGISLTSSNGTSRLYIYGEHYRTGSNSIPTRFDIDVYKWAGSSFQFFETVENTYYNGNRQRFHYHSSLNAWDTGAYIIKHDAIIDGVRHTATINQPITHSGWVTIGDGKNARVAAIFYDSEHSETKIVVRDATNRNQTNAVTANASSGLVLDIRAAMTVFGYSEDAITFDKDGVVQDYAPGEHHVHGNGNPDNVGSTLSLVNSNGTALYSTYAGNEYSISGNGLRYGKRNMTIPVSELKKLGNGTYKFDLQLTVKGRTQGTQTIVTAPLNGPGSGFSTSFNMVVNDGSTRKFTLRQGADADLFLDVSDATPPTADTEQTPTDWTNGNVTMRVFNIKDTGGSGYDYTTRPNGTTATTTTVAQAATSNGKYSFVIRDKAGNTTTKTFNVTNIDKEQPQFVSASATGYDYKNGNDYWIQPNKPIDVTIRQRDTGGSGNKHQYLRLDEGSTTHLVRSRHDFYEGVNSKEDQITNSAVSIDSATRTEHNTSTGYGSVRWRITPKLHGKTYDALSYYYDNADNQRGYVDSGINIRTDGEAPTHVSANLTGARYNNNGIHWVRPNDKVTINMRQHDAHSGNERQYLRVAGNGVDLRSAHEYDRTIDDLYYLDGFNSTTHVQVNSARTVENTAYGETRWEVQPKTHGHTYNLQYYYRDFVMNSRGYGNTGYTLAVDGVGPTVTATKVTNGVTLQFSDAHSGYKNSKYAVTTSATPPSASSYSSTTTSANYTVNKPSNSGWYVHVIAEDNVGNTSQTVYGPYDTDSTPPSHISASITGHRYKTTSESSGAELYYVQPNDILKVRLRQHDAESGNKIQDLRFWQSDPGKPDFIDAYSRHNFGGTVTNKADILTHSSVTIQSANRVESTDYGQVEWTVQPKVDRTSLKVLYYYEDNAGNGNRTADSNYQYTGYRINVDGVAPTVSFGTNGSSTYKTSHSTTVSVADDNSGVKTRQYVWSTSTSQPTSGWTNFTDGQTLTTPSSGGTHYLWVRSEDNVGNVSHTRSNGFNINNVPVADFTYSPTTNIYKGTSLTLMSNSTDADGDTLSYTWEYKEPNSSTWVNMNRNAAYASQQLGKVGTWTFRLTASDGRASASKEKTVTVVNRAPTANFTVSPTTLYNNTTATFTNTSTDPDGDSLTYQWAYQEPGSSSWVNFSTAVSPTRVLNKKGIWKIRLIASDGHTTNTKETSVTVSNRAPVSNFTYSPTTIYTTTTVNFTSSSTDADGDTLTYKWEFKEPNSSTWTSFGTSNTSSKRLDKKGVWQVRLVVTDSSGSSNTNTKNITVLNTNPVANFSFSPTTIYNNTTVTFNNTSSDADGDTLTYTWQRQKPNTTTWENFSTTKNPTQVFNVKGTWKVKLIVSDGTATHQKEVNLTVINRDPQPNFSFSPTTIYNNTNVSFTNTSTDVDGDTLSYKWEAREPNSSTWTQFSTTASPSRVFNKQGNWTVRLTVNDGVVSKSIEKPVTVSNRVPVANFTVSPTTLYNNTTATFTNTSTDADGDTLTHTWSYKEPGTTTWVNFSTATSPTRVLNKKGSWGIRLTVSDGYTTNTKEINVTVSNRAPVTDFTVSPSTIYNNTEVTLTSTSTDADGDAMTYQWSYQEPNSTTWVNFSTTSSVKRVLNKKGTWKIRLVVSDGTVSTERVKDVVVSNRTPSASFSYSPTTVYNTTVVTFNNTSSDPDGDALTYRWEYRKPNTSTWTQFSTAKNPTYTLNEKGVWGIRLTVVDNSGAVNNTTRDITVVNRAPVPNFTYSPSLVYVDTNVTLTNTSTDADSDALTYKWEAREPNGSTWTQFSTSKDPVRKFNKAGNWTVRLTVNDGEVSRSIEKTVTVTNRPPIPNFTINKTPTDRLTTVQFTSTSTDPDGDALTYKWEYRKQGTTTWTSLGTNATASHKFSTVGVFEVRLTVTDIYGASESITKNVTVNNLNPKADFTMAPSPSDRLTTVTITNKSTDPEGDSMTYQYYYRMKGTSSWSSLSTSTNPTFKFPNVGVYEVRLVVTDVHGGKDEIVKEITINNLAPTARFSMSPSPSDRLTTVRFTNTSSDPENDTLTYKYEYRMKSTTTWSTLSTAKEPTFKFPNVGTYEVRLTVTDEYNASHSVTHEIVINNLKPTASFTIRDSVHYEGDSIVATNTSTDPEGDSMVARWTVVDPSGVSRTITTWNLNINSIQAGTYKITLRVTDEYGAFDEVTKNVVVTPLIISSSVSHTDDWKVIHERHGNRPSDFYSGEKFILGSQVTNYPIEYVKASMVGNTVDGYTRTVDTDLSLDITTGGYKLYDGEIYEHWMTDPKYQLARGEVIFTFEVKYTNGVVKRDSVSVFIIDNSFRAFDFYRTN